MENIDLTIAHVGKEVDINFENKIYNGELSEKDIIKFMKENGWTSLVLSNNDTTIHKNPIHEDDYYVWSEISIEDGKPTDYFELELEEYLNAAKYKEVLQGIKGLIKEEFIKEFNPEKQEVIKEKFKVLSYKEDDEQLIYSFYVQEESNVLIYQYTFNSKYKTQEKPFTKNVVVANLRDLNSLF